MAFDYYPAIAGLEFDAERHVYAYEGEILPSVTSILSPLSEAEYSGIDKEILNCAAARGTAVHAAIEAKIKYGIDDIQEDFKPYYEAFRKWYSDNDVKPYVSEYRSCHKTLKYAGSIDLIGEVTGQRAIIDFKTSYRIHAAVCGLQLEAYRQMIMSNACEWTHQKLIVQLKKDGTYKEMKFENDEECWNVYKALLEINKYKKKFRI